MSTAAAITGPVDVLVITVYGTPAPQGSKRAFRNQHTGRIQQVESSKRVKPWREAVKHAALDAARFEDWPTPHPVAVEVTFTFARPKGHYRTGRNAHLLRENAPAFPAGKPDLDKTVRSTLDALTDAGIWTGDEQVAELVARKRYPHTHPDALPSPGAVIRIRELRA